MNKEHYLKENKVYPELLSLSTSLVLLTNTFLLITYPGIEQHNFVLKCEKKKRIKQEFSYPLNAPEGKQGERGLNINDPRILTLIFHKKKCEEKNAVPFWHHVQ